MQREASNRTLSETMAGGSAADVEIRPVTLERWSDLVTLFKTSPVMSSCWCMSPRLRASEFSRFGEESRRRNEELMHGLVAGGTVPGLIAYAGGRPIAWISAGPREGYARLWHWATAKKADDEPAWSIVCMYTDRPYRRQGMTRILIQAAVRYAAEHGAAAVEAYPTDGWGDQVGVSDACTGMASTYRALGFYEVRVTGKNRGRPRLLVRYDLR